MLRDLRRLANEPFDLHVIGGGVTGACIARDAALRGLRVALTEKNDFAHATSAHNSKLIHGGLRYLRNFDLRLVRESLRERRIWQRIAPHLVRPLPFLVPVYDGSWKARATLGTGLALYDLLSFDRAWLDDPQQRLPGHGWFDRSAALVREPVLEGPNFAGAFLYYDAQMYSPERLALECLIDADANGAALANHMAAERLLIRNGRVEGAALQCGLSGRRLDIRAKLTVLAAGPWADLFLNAALGEKSVHRLIRSKGIHLIVPAATRGDALTVATAHGHFFVLPWRGASILGTTDTAFTGSPDAVGVSESEITAFLAIVNAHLPSAHIARADVRHFYAGLRPLVDNGANDTYGASRRAELIDHQKTDRVEGLVSAIGGKWTTSRDLAENAVNLAVRKLDARTRRCVTAATPLPGGRMGSLGAFLGRQAGLPVPNADHLARLYGTRLDGVMRIADTDPALRQPLSPSGDIGAQILFAIREEMAATLADAVMRRTGMGQLGAPQPAALAAAATLMAGELGWSGARKEAEIASLAQFFQTTGETT